MENKIQSWTCPKCGKVIESLYPNQLAFNKGIHKATCKGSKSKVVKEAIENRKESQEKRE